MVLMWIAKNKKTFEENPKRRKKKKPSTTNAPLNVVKFFFMYQKQKNSKGKSRKNISLSSLLVHPCVVCAVALLTGKIEPKPKGKRVHVCWDVFVHSVVSLFVCSFFGPSVCWNKIKRSRDIHLPLCSLLMCVHSCVCRAKCFYLLIQQPAKSPNDRPNSRPTDRLSL